MTAPAAPTPAKTSARNAPKAASWAFAEDFGPESDVAIQARTQSEALGLTPPSRGTASVLTLLARAVQARTVVEVGTGAGVAGLALFRGMQPDGILTSIDPEADHQRQARSAFLAAGIPTQRFRLIAGTPANVLPRLSDGAYDLVFVDGDELEYVEHVEQGLRLLRHGGVLVVHDALLRERVADPADTSEETEAVRSALTLVGENEDLVPALLPVGSGLLVAVKR